MRLSFASTEAQVAPYSFTAWQRRWMPVNRSMGLNPRGLMGNNSDIQQSKQSQLTTFPRFANSSPVAPIVLAATVFGGIVAYEMAQQLLRQGEPPALVVLFTAELRFHRKVPAPVKPKPPANAVSHQLATLLKNPPRALYRKSAILAARRWGKLAPIFYRILVPAGPLNSTKNANSICV